MDVVFRCTPLHRPCLGMAQGVFFSFGCDCLAVKQGGVSVCKSFGIMDWAWNEYSCRCKAYASRLMLFLCSKIHLNATLVVHCL